MKCKKCAIWEQCTFDNNGTVEIGHCNLRGRRTTERFECDMGIPRDKGAWIEKAKQKEKSGLREH